MADTYHLHALRTSSRAWASESSSLWCPSIWHAFKRRDVHVSHTHTYCVFITSMYRVWCQQEVYFASSKYVPWANHGIGILCLLSLIYFTLLLVFLPFHSFARSFFPLSSFRTLLCKFNLNAYFRSCSSITHFHHHHHHREARFYFVSRAKFRRNGFFHFDTKTKTTTSIVLCCSNYDSTRHRPQLKVIRKTYIHTLFTCKCVCLSFKSNCEYCGNLRCRSRPTRSSWHKW